MFYPGMGINLDEDEYNTVLEALSVCKFMQSPAASLSFILQRERFVSAYTSYLVSRDLHGEKYRETFTSILFPSRLSPTRRVFIRSDGNQRYTHIFFQSRRFRRWFLSAGFAVETACTHNGKLRKCVGLWFTE